MDSQTRRGYQHDVSRDPASGRTNLVRASGAGERDAHRTHLLSPSSASAFPWDTGNDTLYEPSTSTSPASHYTPELGFTKAEVQSDEEEDFNSAPSEEEDAMEGSEGSKTGAELLAEKRKMKRFRLTHAQTRYLMSEFARQAHPDAGQRERLSRDIPGLSPRQVQVWFQNRRAKLKRLTTEDQERMMRSRALPENFDFTPALQPGLRDPRHPVDPANSLSSLSLGGGVLPQRPSLRLDSQDPPSSSMASVYKLPSGAGAATGSANLSPVSSINEGSQYSGSQLSESHSPLTTTQYFNPFDRSPNLSASSQAQQDHAELPRQRSASSAKQFRGLPGKSSAYRDYGFSETPRAPTQSSNASRHSPSFLQGRLATQRTSHLASPNPQLYDPRQPINPQAARGSGYYQASYLQNVELSGWQGGQIMPESLRYDASIIQPNGMSLPPTPQLQGANDTVSDPYTHAQLTGYQGPRGPDMYITRNQQPSSARSPAPESGAPAGTGDRGPRGSTFPSHYAHP